MTGIAMHTKKSRGNVLAMMCTSFVALAFAAKDVRAQAHFMRGDSNHDTKLDISDAVFDLAYLFSGGEDPLCADAADVNDDGKIDISDAIAKLGFLFQGGTAPAAPWPRFEGDPTADSLGCLEEEVELTGDITSDLMLTSDKHYRLVSGVFVRSGATLTIEAGTTILGDSATEGFLVIDSGGKIMAEGTETHPIVFTSDKPVGERGRGDWGGMIILGRSDNNVEGGEALAEGLEGSLWGGGANPIPDDSSGVLSYVRVEYGGTEISEGNEINSISLFGVGSGTQVDHIQVKYNLDDGIEWFGGRVSAKYVVATGIRDDNFDYSFGWNGRGQFWVCQQRGDDADRGFEVDNHEDTFGARPLTNPIVSNVTLIGDPSTDPSRPESDTGIVLRRGAGGRIYNGIICGFKDAGVDIDDGVTTNNNPTDGTLALDYFVFWNNKDDAETGESGEEAETAENGFKYTTVQFLTELNTHNVFTDTSPLVDAYNLDAPNFRPVTGGPADANGFDVATLDSFFEATNYLGAVPPTGEDWTQARWLSYRQN